MVYKVNLHRGLETRDDGFTVLSPCPAHRTQRRQLFERLNTAPGMNMLKTDEIVKLATALSRNKPNGAVSYGTEGGLFQAAGIPTVLCGPGDI